MTHVFDEEGWEQGAMNSQDVEIIMHREAHFGGNFDVMIDYYAKEGKGCSPSIEPERIKQLAELEKTSGENLAATLLTGADAEKIQKVRDLYKNLREVYDRPEDGNPIPKLVADLILCEEMDTQAVVDAFLPYKLSATQALIDLLRNLDFYDPLFPGYGFAPEIAVECLAKIGDKRAIIALFEAIGDGDFFHDEGVLHALKAIGEPAKEFLLRALKSRPFNEDNERAAIALESFKGDVVVGHAAIELLQMPDVLKDPVFSTYLIYLCEGMPASDFKKPLEQLCETPKLSKDLVRDVNTVIATLT